MPVQNTFIKISVFQFIFFPQPYFGNIITIPVIYHTDIVLLRTDRRHKTDNHVLRAQHRLPHLFEFFTDFYISDHSKIPVHDNKIIKVRYSGNIFFSGLFIRDRCDPLPDLFDIRLTCSGYSGRDLDFYNSFRIQAFDVDDRKQRQCGHPCCMSSN